MSKDKGAMIAKITHGVPENEGGEGGPLRDYYMTWHDMTNRGERVQKRLQCFAKAVSMRPLRKRIAF